MYIVALLLVPLFVAAGFYVRSPSTVTWREFLLQLGVGVGVAFGAGVVGTCSTLEDVEHLNGRVVEKDDYTSSCCHCTQRCASTDRDGNCTMWVEDCPHIFDYAWAVKLSTDHTLVDDCNVWDDPPTWWTTARVGEPATVEHTYTNYLKADPDTLFERGALEEHLALVPDEFPGVYDMFRSDKVVAGRGWAPKSWERELSELNADLGARKQVDLSVYITDVADPRFADAVEKKWLYGPKNAVIVVVGAPDRVNIAWARVVTISRVEAFKVHVRDALTGLRLDDPRVMQLLRSAVEHEFERTPMSTFEYLESATRPTTGIFVVSLLLVLLASVGLGCYMHANDVFGESSVGRWSARWRRKQ